MYVVDGHNLIPHVPGLSLQDMDDEAALIARLQVFARFQRGAGRQIEVFFDKAPPGQSGTRGYGVVRAHFVPAGRTADDAINAFLTGLGKKAREASVVSNDRQVQARARELHAQVIRSDDFAARLEEAQARAAQPTPRPAVPTTPSAPAEGYLSEWLDIFGIDPDQASQPIEPPPSHKRARKNARGSSTPGPSPSPARPVKPAKPRPHHGFPKKS